MDLSEWEKTIEWAAVVVSCLIEKDGKYLMVQEAQPRAYGLWNLPAGHVDKDETLENAAIRETKEENGYDIELGKEIAIYHESAKQRIKHVYSAKIVGGKLTTQLGEILDVKWLSFNDIKALNKVGKLRRPWVWDVINKV